MSQQIPASRFELVRSCTTSLQLSRILPIASCCERLSRFADESRNAGGHEGWSPYHQNL